MYYFSSYGVEGPADEGCITSVCLDIDVAASLEDAGGMGGASTFEA